MSKMSRSPPPGVEMIVSPTWLETAGKWIAHHLPQ
jgi:hypothetical protein